MKTIPLTKPLPDPVLLDCARYLENDLTEEERWQLREAHQEIHQEDLLSGLDDDN